MILPRVLKGFSVQINGIDFRTRTEEIELPALKFKEALIESGLPGSLPVELCVLEKMESKVKTLDVPDDVFLSFGLIRGRWVTVIATSAIQRQGSKPEQVLSIIYGLVNNSPAETWKAGDHKSAGFNLEIVVSRWSLSVNKIPVVNIDIENSIVMIGGHDHYAEIRETLMI